MFIFHKETTLEDLGNGVTRRILAHDGKMMAVEVNFEAGAIGPDNRLQTTFDWYCRTTSDILLNLDTLQW